MSCGYGIGGRRWCSTSGAGDCPRADVEHGQAVVPDGVGQAARPAGADHVLVSCIVSPGFDFADATID
ncbi:cupin domain-containing protein [Nocardia sp. NPDC051990]|uniref:cupin domain-containing protein n=1 Tax=Nocardia sp. NPDC051990 TaxID=3155285 RepID=UPI003430B4FF